MIARPILFAAFAIGAALCAVPLLGVHGVESALLLGATLPPLCAAAAARVAARVRLGSAAAGMTGAAAPTALQLAGRCVAAGLLVLLVPVALLGLNALRVRNCAPLEGLAFIAFGPGAGVVLASLIGANLGALPLRPALCGALAAALPLLDSARALFDFYATPAVYAYGQFFGYFPGSLYDELVEFPPPLLSLRALTALWCIALVCLLVRHYDRDARTLRLRPQPSTRAALLGLVLAAGGALTGAVLSERLGHRSSVASIAEALGGRIDSARCVLLVPREFPRPKRARLAQDCDFRVRQMERWFGLRQPERVRVLVFRNAAEKQRLMGAANTNIAKPWRREIYLQDEAWPHSILAHEMAHIVAGNTGRGPFRIAGPLGGWIPDFGLIEGVAVAAAFANSSAGGLTPHQWARAMLELNLAPPLAEMFATGFLQQQRRVAYTLTGSLLAYIAEQHGAAAVRRIYRGEPVPEVLGIGWAELEQRFHAFLRAVKLPEAARALAAQRFAGSSVLSSVCPHAKAKLAQKLENDLQAGALVAAEQSCREILAIDPAENAVRATLATVLARAGDERASALELQRLAAPGAAPPAVVAGARQWIADEAFRAGRYTEAHSTYRELLTQPTDRDSLRLLQVKRLALEGSARQRDLLFALLIGEPGQPADGAYAVYLTRELRSERSDGLPYYLEARQLHSRERFAESRRLLARARELGLPSPELAGEALRLLAVDTYGAGDRARSAALWRQYAAENLDPAPQAEAAEWLLRVRLGSAERSRE